MIIGVDIDNVIADTEKELRRLVYSMHGVTLGREDIKDYSLAGLPGLMPADIDNLISIFHDGEVFLRLEVFEGAKDTLDMLTKQHRVILVTSRPDNVADHTVQWLDRHGIPYHEIYFESKSKINGIPYELFIEDQENFASELADEGTFVLLYDAPWNRHVEHENIERVYTWQDIRKFCFPPCALGH